MKQTRKVEFDEESIDATSPIRRGRPINIEIPQVRVLHQSTSNETIMPATVKIRRTPSKDDMSPATDGTHILRKSTSKDIVSPTLRKIRSAISLKPPFPRTALKGLQPQSISLLRIMCFFDPTDIRERYLTAICGRYSTHIGRSEATLSNFPIQPNEMRLALDELKQKQLISCPVESLGMRINDQVRKEILNQLKNIPAVFEVAFETVAFVLQELWPSMMGPQKNEPEFDEYAKDNLWGGRNELVKHVEALEGLFQGANTDMRELCASGRYLMLLMEAAWYHLERANYPEADQLVEAALRTSKLACMVPKTLLANLHRTRAALAFELGHTDRENFEVEQVISLFPEAFQQPDPAAVRDWCRGCPTVEWARTNNAILQSGLLAAAPDGVGLSPWGFDEVQGVSDLAPFLSLRYFGWMNYAEGRLDDAAKCFLQGLGDRKRVFGIDDSVGPRTGELLYALGVVRDAQNNHSESFNYFKRALALFKKTDEDGRRKAKTHYKIALHYISRVVPKVAELKLILHVEDEVLRLEGFRLAALRRAELNLAEPSLPEIDLAKQSIAELNLADEHLEAASAFYRYHGTNNEYAPQLARVYLQGAQVQSLHGEAAAANKALLESFRYRSKMVADCVRRGKEVNVTDFDAEVVIWAR